jgi:hypothetical protein
MGLELLTQADYVLNACGRPTPPKGYRFVDLPRIIPYHQTIGVLPGQFGDLLDEVGCGLKFTNISLYTVSILSTIDALSPPTPSCVLTGDPVAGFTITFTQQTVGDLNLTQALALLAATPGVPALVSAVIVPGAALDPPNESLNGGGVGPLVGGSLSIPFPTQDRVENTANTLFLCRGIMLQTDPVSVRIKWPNGRYWNQFPSNNPLATAGAGANFPQGTGGNLYALDEDMPIERGGKVAIEMSGTNAGTVDVQLWGVLRYLLKATGEDLAEVDGETCIIGYPETAKQTGGPTCLIGYPVPAGAKGKAGSVMIPDPIGVLKARERFHCWPNGNILAPEFLLGNQCETDPYQEPFTFLSDSYTVAAGAQSYSNSVAVPGRDDLRIRRWRAITTWSEGGSGTPQVGLRVPSGYSLTGGDLIPINLGYWYPAFPTLVLKHGTEIIIDVSLPSGASGSVTVQIEFDSAKIRRGQ